MATKNYNKVVCQISDVFSGLRKNCKSVLELGKFSAHVEVPYATEVKKPDDVQKAGDEALQKEADALVDLVERLIRKLRDLQDESNQKKATKEAKKAVESAEKHVKEALTDINTAVRKAVQAEVKSQAKAKESLRSIGRNSFRGMKLARDAFRGDDEDEQELAGDFQDAAKDSANSAEKVAAYGKKESAQRSKLQSALLDLKKPLSEAAGALGRGEKIDFAKFKRENSKLVRDLENESASYEKLLLGIDKKLDKEAGNAAGDLAQLFKAEKDGLSDYTKLRDQYVQGVEDIGAALGDLSSAAQDAVAVISEDFSANDFKKATDELDRVGKDFHAALDALTKTAEKLKKAAKKF